MLVVLVQAQTQFCHLRGCSCHYLSAPPLALKGIEWTSILSGSSFLFQTSNKPLFTVYASMKWNRDSQRFLFGMFLANRFVSVCVSGQGWAADCTGCEITEFLWVGKFFVPESALWP